MGRYFLEVLKSSRPMTSTLMMQTEKKISKTSVFKTTLIQLNAIEGFKTSTRHETSNPTYFIEDRKLECQDTKWNEFAESMGLRDECNRHYSVVKGVKFLEQLINSGLF